jgi:hypothetical protein
MSLGSNGVCLVRSLRKNPTRHCYTNLCINDPSLVRFAPKFVQYWNVLKHPKTWVWGPMAWIACVRCERIRLIIVAQNCALMTKFGPICTKVRPVGPKCPETCVRGPMGCMWCVRYEYFQGDIVRGTFALMTPIRPNLHPKSCCNGTVRNTPKHKSGVQWGGSYNFIAKKSSMTSLHELVH